MPYSVFLSHSLSSEDRSTVDLINRQFAPFDIDCHVAERDWKFGESISTKLEAAIRRSDCLLALLTRGGAQSPYVNQEIGMAVGLGKLVLPIVEDGVDIKGFDPGVEWVPFDRSRPEMMMQQITPRVTAMASRKNVSMAVSIAILAVIAAWAFRDG